MKTKRVLAVMITSFFLLNGCSNNDSVEESESASKASGSKSSVISQTYPKAQQEVLETFGAIGATITAGAGTGYDSEYMNKLISFHAYGEKFTEFNNGKLYDSAGNEHNERSTFGVAVEKGGVKKFAALDDEIKVAVYFGNVANVTFISDFLLKFEGVDDPVKVNSLITLLFVKTEGKWKMVHEHHSPMYDGSAEKSSFASKAFLSKTASGYKSSVISQSYPKAQQEVLETFGAIGATITAGAGTGYDSEYMDQLISFHFKLHELGPTVMMAATMYPRAEAEKLMKFWIDFTRSLPNEVSSDCIHWSVPVHPGFPEALHGTEVTILAGMYFGSPEDGERILQPMREVATPILDMSGIIPYTAVNKMFDPFLVKGTLNSYWKSLYVKDIDENLMQLIIDKVNNSPSGECLMSIRNLQGALSEVAEDATAFGDRSSRFLVSIDTMWNDDALHDRCIQWTKQFFSELKQYSDGQVYFNFNSDMSGSKDLAEDSFGSNYQRLKDIKIFL